MGHGLDSLGLSMTHLKEQGWVVTGSHSNGSLSAALAGGGLGGAAPGCLVVKTKLATKI